MPHCTTKRTSCSLGTHDSSKILSGECKIITPCPQWCDGVRNTLFGDSYIVEVLSEGKSLTRNKTNADGITTQVKVPFQYNVGVGEGVFVNTHGSIANCAVGFNALQGIYGCENIALGFEAGICSGTSYCDLLTSNPSESWQSTGVCLLGAKTCNKEVTSWGDKDVVSALVGLVDACFDASEGKVDSTDSGMWKKLNFSVALGAGATTANHYECVIGGDIEASFETELINQGEATAHIRMTQKAENTKSNGIRCLKGGQKTSKLRNEIDTLLASPNWTTAAAALTALEENFIYNPDKTDPCQPQTNKIPVFSVATEQHPLSQINMLTLFPSINTPGKSTENIVTGSWSKEDLNFNSFPTTIGADGKRCIACIPILNGSNTDAVFTANTITWTECLVRGIPLKVGDLYARPNVTGDFQLCVCMPAAMSQ
jgi:hypothetical protein